MNLSWVFTLYITSSIFQSEQGFSQLFVFFIIFLNILIIDWSGIIRSSANLFLVLWTQGYLRVKAECVFSDVFWQSPPLPVGVRKATSPYLAGWPKPRRVICQAVRGFWQLPSDSARCWQSYSGTGIQNREDDVVGLRCFWGRGRVDVCFFFSLALSLLLFFF